MVVNVPNVSPVFFRGAEPTKRVRVEALPGVVALKQDIVGRWAKQGYRRGERKVLVGVRAGGRCRGRGRNNGAQAVGQGHADIARHRRAIEHGNPCGGAIGRHQHFTDVGFRDRRR